MKWRRRRPTLHWDLDRSVNRLFDNFGQYKDAVRAQTKEAWRGGPRREIATYDNWRICPTGGLVLVWLDIEPQHHLDAFVLSSISSYIIPLQILYAVSIHTSPTVYKLTSPLGIIMISLQGGKLPYRRLQDVRKQCDRK
jgi:hypothetical protein